MKIQRILLVGLLCSGPLRAAEPLQMAVVGGLVLSGSWQLLESRLESATGVDLQLAEAANKNSVVPAFASGRADLLLIHGGAETFALQARGLAGSLRTWGWNEHVIVGPTSDPAKVREAASAADALARIAASGAKFLAPADAGAHESVHRALQQAGIGYRSDWVVLEEGVRPHARLAQAGMSEAYTMAGAIPVAFGRLAGEGMQTLLSGDPLLRRAYVAVEPGDRHPAGAAAREQARRVVDYLLSPAGQRDVQAAGAGWLFANDSGLPVVAAASPAVGAGRRSAAPLSPAAR
jgi:tungstate transport system substrate-binding protein